MCLFDRQALTKDVANALIEASVSFHHGQIEAYKRALNTEQDSQSKWVLQNLLENAEIAKRNRLPLCDDTGIPHLFLEIGDDALVPNGFFKAVEGGIRLGLRELPGRPMAVKGIDDFIRISQSEGMYEDSGMLEMAPLQIRRTLGNSIRLTLLMYGGGPEIRGKTMRVFHKHSVDVVKKTMVEWAVEGVKLLGCQPCTLAFGIGRTNLEAASLAFEAMALGDFSNQSQFENEITNEVNKSRIGPLGLGGRTSVIGTFIKVGPQRASGVRIVSLRIGCCMDPRRSIREWVFN
jgi:fumarate hydratase subunit alpha